jgi:hypothetical protein
MPWLIANPPGFRRKESEKSAQGKLQTVPVERKNGARGLDYSLRRRP